MSDQAPSIGRIVHYVSRGSADGAFPSVCRAAVITEVHPKEPASAQVFVGLAVLNPTGLFFDDRVQYAETSGGQADPDCTELHENGPHRYCAACPWTEPSLRPGTWHWPERV